jgi:hypothetical protein|tara:strand:+ start:384 stop:848 length:465 start_codon:yes stop_codon:yes gene_type:complete
VVIESIAAATATLSALNNLIAQCNETGQGVQQVMGMISDFGEGITEFEAQRRQSTFKPLSQNEILKLQMIKRQYERHWQSVHDLLLVADPKLLDDFKAAKAQQDRDRQEHLRMIARKKKARDHLINQILVGGTTLIIGGAIIAAGFVIMVKVYG